MPAYKPIRQRLEDKSIKQGECIAWKGAVSSSGYGVIGAGQGKIDYVHRVSYRIHIGEIPDSLHIDHLCSKKLCVNPDHLEAVSQKLNNVRMWSRRLEKTCLNGHSSSYRKKMPSGRTYCQECHREQRRDKKALLTGDRAHTYTEGGFIGTEHTSLTPIGAAPTGKVLKAPGVAGIPPEVMRQRIQQVIENGQKVQRVLDNDQTGG